MLDLGSQFGGEGRLPAASVLRAQSDTEILEALNVGPQVPNLFDRLNRHGCGVATNVDA